MIIIQIMRTPKRGGFCALDQYQQGPSTRFLYSGNSYKAKITVMIAGIILIVCGLLIAFYPPLLSIIVALVLISVGIVTTMVAYSFRRQGTQRNSEVIEFIFRH